MEPVDSDFDLDFMRTKYIEMTFKYLVIIEYNNVQWKEYIKLVILVETLYIIKLNTFDVHDIYQRRYLQLWSHVTQHDIRKL